MEPTNSENTDAQEVTEAIAAGWASVLLDLNEKQTQPRQSKTADSNSNMEEQRCKSTSKLTPK
jgi:hypothetical protein